MSRARTLDLSRCGSALILKPSSLGDIVHTLPAVRALRRSFPALTLRWLCNEEWTPLLAGHPDLEAVIPFPRRRFRGPAGLPALVRWVRAFRRQPREEPEAALDFQGLLRSALLGRIRGVSFLAGLSDAREGASWLYHRVVPVDPGWHAVDRYLCLARAAGATVHPEALEWPLPEGEAPGCELPRDFIVVHPMARGAGKSLAPDALQALCDHLAPAGVVLAGHGPDLPRVSGAHVISLVNGTRISQLIWLLRHARAVVSVDSGPMHIAAALQPARTVGIHSWSDPRRVGPYDPRCWVWKAGLLCRRTELGEAEAAATAAFSPADARALAEFVLQLAAD